MEHTKKQPEPMPARIEWIEDVEYYPVYISKNVYTKVKGMKRSKIADYCISKIVNESGNAMLSIDRTELMEQIGDMFDVMGDKEVPCSSFLLLVRINNIVE